MTITPDMAEVIADAIESALIDVHVALPGCVQAYDPDAQTATVQLQVARTLPTSAGLYVTEDLPVLENVPVAFPRTRRFALTFPIEPGDYGEVLFHEMSIDRWRSKAANTSPGDVGRHTLTGGVFRPGLMPNSEVIADDVSSDLVMGEIGGVQVRVKPGGSCEVVSGGGPSAADYVAMAGKTLSELQAIVNGYNTHSHVSAAPGNPTTPPAVPLVPPTDVASSNLKADD